MAKLAATLVTAFMLTWLSGTGKTAFLPETASLIHCEGHDVAIAVTTRVHVNKSPATSKDYPPKPIAILILAFLFLNGVYCLIAGRIYPGPGASAIRRDEQPGRYWRNICGYLVGCIIFGVVLCKLAHLL